MSRRIRVAHVATVDLTVRFLLLGQLRRLRDDGFEVAAISAPGPWVPEIEAEGIRHIAWPHATRGWDLRADGRAFAELLAILRRERFDLVHTHTPKPGIMGRIAARVAGVPCVVNTVHGLYTTNDDSAPRRTAVLALERVAARFSDLELYQSEEDLAWARRIGVVSGSKSVLLGNGTDLRLFDPQTVNPDRLIQLRSDLGIPPQAPVVGTVGRLVAEKGYREFIAAARMVRKVLPETVFVAVGAEEPEKADTLSGEEIDRAGGDVVFTGWRSDAADLIALMDVFVLASWREGVPRSAIEAAAMGRAMVLTDIRGCREVVRDGVDGLLVPPRDPGRLADAITRLLGDPGLRTRLGAAARARAVERFDERRVEDLILERYEDLLHRKGRVHARAREDEATHANGAFRVRPARPSDAPVLARLHRDALPDAFLSKLGDRFLSVFYRALATEEGAVALVAEDGDGVLGFASGAASMKDFSRRFRSRYGAAAAIAAVPRLRPGMVRGLRESARYAGATGELPDAELISIAVAPNHRHRGAGRVLAEGVITGLSERGAHQVKVMVGAEAPANEFYRTLGFDHASSVAVHDGVRSNVWVITCPS